MDNKLSNMNILILAPHPDDESIGMGGTIKKLSKKNNILLCVLTDGAVFDSSGQKKILERKKDWNYEFYIYFCIVYEFFV